MTAARLIDRAAEVRMGLVIAMEAMTDELDTDFSVYSLIDMIRQIDAEINRLGGIIAEEWADELTDLNREYERSRL